jgi:hypothetical protein
MALSVSQMAAITHRLILPKAVDNVFNSNPLLFRFKEKGIKYDGGREIVQPVINAKWNSQGAYEGYDILSTNPNDVVTAAVFDWRQYAGTVTISGREEILNGGKSGILNLLEIKRQVMELSLEDTLGTDLQGSNAGGKSIDGLGLVLSDTSTYGGIAVADMADWKARVHTLAVAGTLTLNEMQKFYGKLVIGNDKPTIGVTRQSVFDKYWTMLQPDKRYVSTMKGDGGFDTLAFNSMPIVVDSHVPGSDGGTQDNDLQFLNEKYLWLFIHSGTNWKVVPIPALKDQDVKMTRVLLATNLACSLRKQQGVISTIDPNL